MAAEANVHTARATRRDPRKGEAVWTPPPGHGTSCLWEAEMFGKKLD